jgi:tetratricopeptide (TPR) repeat protein
MGKATEFIRSSPLRALGLAGRKFLLAWNRGQIPQIESMDSFARAAGPLGLPLLGSFAFLAILGLAGTAWAARGDPSGRWLVGYLALVSFSLMPFFVTDRYRHHLVPALAPLAGIAIAGIAGAARGRATPPRVRSALAVGLATGIVFAPVGAVRPARLGEWAFTVDRAIRLLDRGAYAEAARAFAHAENSLPVTHAESLSTSERTNLAAFYFRYGIALEALDRHDEAITRWERAIALNPNDASSLGRLSLAYALDGRTADEARVRMLGSPGAADSCSSMTAEPRWAWRPDGGERLLGSPAGAPRTVHGVGWLIRLEVQAGRLVAARTLTGRAAG